MRIIFLFLLIQVVKGQNFSIGTQGGSIHAHVFENQKKNNFIIIGGNINFNKEYFVIEANYGYCDLGSEGNAKLNEVGLTAGFCTLEEKILSLEMKLGVLYSRFDVVNKTSSFLPISNQIHPSFKTTINVKLGKNSRFIVKGNYEVNRVTYEINSRITSLVFFSKLTLGVNFLLFKQHAPQKITDNNN